MHDFFSSAVFSHNHKEHQGTVVVIIWAYYIIGLSGSGSHEHELIMAVARLRGF